MYAMQRCCAVPLSLSNCIVQGTYIADFGDYPKRRRAFLRLTDHMDAVKCQLFETLMLPDPPYKHEIWATGLDHGQACKALHKRFWWQLLGVTRPVTNVISSAEVGRCPL